MNRNNNNDKLNKLECQRSEKKKKKKKRKKKKRKKREKSTAHKRLKKRMGQYTTTCSLSRQTPLSTSKRTNKLFFDKQTTRQMKRRSCHALLLVETPANRTQGSSQKGKRADSKRSMQAPILACAIFNRGNLYYVFSVQGPSFQHPAPQCGAAQAVKLWSSQCRGQQ